MEIKGISPELTTFIVSAVLVAINAAMIAIQSFSGSQIDWSVVAGSVFMAVVTYITTKYHDNRLSPVAAAKAEEALTPAQSVELERG